MTFVLDNNLPPKLAEILRIAGSDVVHLREHCNGRGDVPDVEWMWDLAKRKWVAITYDRKIEAKPNERAALVASGLTIIFVTNTVQALSHKQQLAFFIGHWDKAEEAAASARPQVLVPLAGKRQGEAVRQVAAGQPGSLFTRSSG